MMIFNNFYKIAKITKFSNYYSLQFRGIVDRRPDVYYTSSNKRKFFFTNELRPPLKNLEPVNNEQRSVYDTRPPSKKFLLDILRRPYLEPVHNKSPKYNHPPPPRNLDPVHNKSPKYNPSSPMDLDSVYKKPTKYNHPPPPRNLDPVHNKPKYYRTTFIDCYFSWDELRIKPKVPPTSGDFSWDELRIKPKVPPPPRDLDPVHNKPLKYNPKKDNE